MHLLIPYAAPLAEDMAAALQGLALPTLQRMLRRLQPQLPDIGPEDSLSTPHERALGAALGWRMSVPAGPGAPEPAADAGRGNSERPGMSGYADGALPWAARAAVSDGIAIGERAWGLLTPAHWQLGQKRVSLLDPAALALTDAESHRFFDSVRPLFEAHGWFLAWGAALRWYAAHESLADLPCASLDRAVGRPIDAWLAPTAAARPLRRLQAEVQMLLHDHPLNAAREADGHPPVNSFWLSGTGRLPTTPQPTDADIVVDDRLRTALWQRDWPQWRSHWAALDAGPLEQVFAAARDGAAVAVTLSGERAAWRHGPERRGWIARAASGLRAPPLSLLLAAL